jgi:hypothetical protein
VEKNELVASIRKHSAAGAKFLADGDYMAAGSHYRTAASLLTTLIVEFPEGDGAVPLHVQLEQIQVVSGEAIADLMVDDMRSARDAIEQLTEIVTEDLPAPSTLPPKTPSP